MKNNTKSSLRDRMLKAGAWTATGFMIQKILQLLSNLLLTRLLFPEAFGVMALANTALIGLNMLSDVGIKPAIIQSNRGSEHEFLNTAWTMQVLRGLFIFIWALILSYPISIIYKYKDLFPIISLLGATSFISGFSSISLATAERNLQTKILAINSVFGQIISLFFTVVLAWYLKSIWSLAYGALLGAAASTILSHIIAPHHNHHFRWESETVAALTRFGRWIFLSTAATFLGGQGLRALQGLYVTPATLGLISIAQTLAWIPGDLTSQLMTIVGFPALSEIFLQRPEKFSSTFKSMRNKVLIFSIPIFLIINILSGSIISIMYDNRYFEAGGYLSIVAITSAIGIMPLGYQSAMLAQGKTKGHFAVILVTVFSKITFTALGFRYYSVEGMLWGIGIGSFIGYLYASYYAVKMNIFNFKLDLIAFLATACGVLATHIRSI